jgi:hypothetical protein
MSFYVHLGSFRNPRTSQNSPFNSPHAKKGHKTHFFISFLNAGRQKESKVFNPIKPLAAQ